MKKILFAAALLASASAFAQTKVDYSKSDFVSGDEIFFEDLVEGERLGEFPSHWDLLGGEECEIASLNGEQVIKISGWWTQIIPLMKTSDYLPEEFTIEFDVWSPATMGSSLNDHLDLILYSADMDELFHAELNPAFNEVPEESAQANLNFSFYPPSLEEPRYGEAKGNLLTPLIKADSWLKVQVSFNKRALKYYVNGVRMINIPNMAAPTRMKLVSVSNCDEKDRFFIKNIRMAKGAVPLYDRLASDGKIVSYAITFDTGKATIKPESEVEIGRVAKLMQEHPELSFEVQGHCDSTGSDSVNDPLSQQRAEAIVVALVAKGIDASRLTAVGKGSHAPIADNGTSEGRARNRRVEFVKK